MRHNFHIASALASIVLVAACGQGDDKMAGQVVAKVNSDEITVHEINAVLARTPNVPPQLAEQARKRILDELIRQELAAQKAIATKLDRSPDVVLSIEMAKRGILARAYLQHIAAAQFAPSEDEIKKYYVDHPELFAQRRLYTVIEISVTPNDRITAERLQQVADSGNMQKVEEWLASQGAQFVTRRAVRAAEQLPLKLLPTLRSMKDGETRLLKGSDGGLNVIQVVATESASLDEKATEPAIRRFLSNERSSETVAAEMNRLTKEAKIQYFGAFANGSSGAAPAGGERSAPNGAETSTSSPPHK
jgi:EpsD family peptidyl-prolyl cis-trans isomerase